MIASNCSRRRSCDERTREHVLSIADLRERTQHIELPRRRPGQRHLVTFEPNREQRHAEPSVISKRRRDSYLPLRSAARVYSESARPTSTHRDKKIGASIL